MPVTARRAGCATARVRSSKIRSNATKARLIAAHGKEECALVPNRSLVRSRSLQRWICARPRHFHSSPRASHPGRDQSPTTPIANASSTPSRELDVAVVGGGITGLATAYYINKVHPQARVTIYEKGSTFGGWLRSEPVPVDSQGGTVLFEHGPRTLRSAGNGWLAMYMAHDIGLDDETIFVQKGFPAAGNRYVYYPDHLVNMQAPGTPGFWQTMIHNFFREPAFEGFLGGLWRERSVPPRSLDLHDESIGDFVARRHSSHMVDRLLSAVFHGIYAGDVYQLSARSLLSTMWRREGMIGHLVSFKKFRRFTMLGNEDQVSTERLWKESTRFSGSARTANLFTFRGGLAQLSDTLVKHLRANTANRFAPQSNITDMANKADGGVDVTLQTGETSAHSHLVWSATPASLAATADLDQETKAALRAIPSVTVMTVNLYYKEKDLHPPGFGYLIPLATPLEQNPELALGVVFDNMYSEPVEMPVEMREYIHGPSQDTARDRGTKLTVMLGGHYWDGWSSYPTEADGVRMAKSILKRHLGIKHEPVVAAAHLNLDCIPQYTVGHFERLMTVSDGLLARYKGSVMVAGGWINGVGVNDCLKSAWDTVSELGRPGLGPRPAPQCGLERIIHEEALYWGVYRKS